MPCPLWPLLLASPLRPRGLVASTVIIISSSSRFDSSTEQRLRPGAPCRPTQCHSGEKLPSACRLYAHKSFSPKVLLAPDSVLLLQTNPAAYLNVCLLTQGGNTEGTRLVPVGRGRGGSMAGLLLATQEVPGPGSQQHPQFKGVWGSR